MSNCDLVAARSLIDLAASRLALRTPALRAATASTRPNRSAQQLPCGRHGVPTAVTAGPNDVVNSAKRELLRTPRQLFGDGRSDRSSKLIRGLVTEAAAGFRSRRGLSNDDSAPVTPHNAPFPTHKAARVRRARTTRRQQNMPLCTLLLFRQSAET